ncbi:hypothetical protein LCGC14_1596810 [marine sediment metagenome]|uniref:Uncharacterized protein n=1 Tax=marine sediment metagenome TaxID=412755 RepID=A0A0F9LCN1_9ZZZZ
MRLKNMENGLDIKLDEFKRMKSIDRDILMYNNLVHIRKKIDDYQFHKKIQYLWLIGLTIFVGLKRFIGL